MRFFHLGHKAGQKLGSFRKKVSLKVSNLVKWKSTEDQNLQSRLPCC